MEGLVTAGVTNYTEWIPKLSKIFSKISPSTPERYTFLTNAIRWTAKGSSTRGHPFLHQVCAFSKLKTTHNILFMRILVLSAKRKV